MSNDIDYLESLLFADDDNPVDYSKSPNYVSARNLYEAGDAKAADKIIDKELKQHPKSPYAHKTKSDILVALGIWNEDVSHHVTTAIDLFEELGDESDEYYVAVENVLRFVQVAPGLEARYAVMASDLAKHMPKARNLVLWGYFADAYRMRGKAIVAYKAAIKAKKDNGDPSNDVIYGRHLIPSLLRAGNEDEARRTLDQAEIECPDGTETRFARAYMLDREGRYDEAIDICLETAFRTNDDNENEDDDDICEHDDKWANRLWDIADADYDLVISKLEKFADRADASPAVLQLAYNISSQNNPKDFFRIRRRMQAAGIEIEDAGATDFHVYWTMQAYAKALEAADHWMADVRALPPSDERANWVITIRCMKAACLGCLGNSQAAEAEFAAIEKEAPENDNVHYWHAFTQANYTLDFANCLAHAQKAQALDPDNDYAVHACTLFQMTSYYNTGRLAEAQDQARQILSLESQTDDRQTDDDRIFRYYPNLHTPAANKYGGELYGSLAHAILGDKEQALKAIDDMLAQPNLAPEILQINLSIAADTCCVLGMEDEAFAYVGKSLEAGARDFTYLKCDPILAPLRQRPEWDELIRKYELRFSFEVEELE